jgi:hypothetical protein
VSPEECIPTCIWCREGRGNVTDATCPIHLVATGIQGHNHIKLKFTIYICPTIITNYLALLFFVATRGGGGGKSSVSHSAESKDGKPLEDLCCLVGVAAAFVGRGATGLSSRGVGAFLSASRDIDCIECDNECSSCFLELLHILQDSLNCENIAARSL